MLSVPEVEEEEDEAQVYLLGRNRELNMELDVAAGGSSTWKVHVDEKSVGDETSHMISTGNFYHLLWKFMSFCLLHCKVHAFHNLSSFLPDFPSWGMSRVDERKTGFFVVILQIPGTK